MKIHIIGGSGTGKSYFARQLCRNFHLTHFDLDDLFWDNTAGRYGIKNPAERRTQQLNQILRTDNWVLEGVYYAWVNDSFQLADTIFVLDIPISICKFRLIRRFAKRKLGIENGKKETIKSLMDLLSWTGKFQNRNLPQIYSILEQYKQKVIVIRSKKELARYINGSHLFAENGR